MGVSRPLDLNLTLSDAQGFTWEIFQKRNHGSTPEVPYPDYHTPHAKSHPTINIMKLFSYSAATVDHWAGLGNAQFKKLSLSTRDRELVIMLTTSKFDSTYEWTHHLPLSLLAGVTKQQQLALEASGK